MQPIAVLSNCGSLLEVDKVRTKSQESGGSKWIGTIDHRLMRENTIRNYRMGRASREEICDATDELIRVAEHFGELAAMPCPICGSSKLVYVDFAFGSKLPSSGQVVAEGTLLNLSGRVGDFDTYQVEVCKDCLWNHLVQKQTPNRD